MIKAPGLPLAAAFFAASCASAPPQVPPPAATAPPRSERVVADDVLANAVYSRLNADPVYYFRHVDVAVDRRGVAHLSGYVWSSEAIYRARQIAQSVPGITGVVTAQLELERNGRSNGTAR
jgi:BON domain